MPDEITNADTTPGLFGPGIFGTGIDLSALDEDTAWRLGVFFGEQLAAADRAGYDRAVANLRDREKWRAWWVAYPDGDPGNTPLALAGYLESTRESS